MAGQINGTSGYEEAAGQGLWAAINAALALRGEPELILTRSQAYIAVLVDDLVTKGTLEPYRMFTSRAEHRLLLREDNADERLTGIGRDLGLVDDSRWQRFTRKQAEVGEIMAGLEAVRVRPDAATRDTVEAMGGTIPQKAVSLKELLRQPELSIESLAPLWPELANFDGEALEEAEIKTKYEGYLRRQQELVDRFDKMEQTILPDDMSYAGIPGLSREVTEKLTSIQPRTLGQAGRISGVTPAALSCPRSSSRRWAGSDPNGPRDHFSRSEAQWAKDGTKNPSTSSWARASSRSTNTSSKTASRVSSAGMTSSWGPRTFKRMTLPLLMTS